MPFCAIKVQTPLSTQRIAQIIYGDRQAIKEHPILYGISMEGVSQITRRFPVYPSTEFLLKRVVEER